MSNGLIFFITSCTFYTQCIVSWLGSTGVSFAGNKNIEHQENNHKQNQQWGVSEVNATPPLASNVQQRTL